MNFNLLWDITGYWMCSIKVLVCLFIMFDVGYNAKPVGSICRCEKYAFDKKPFVAIWNSPTIG